MTTTTLALQPGMVVRVDGLRGMFVAVEPAPGRNCWWFLPCDLNGRWNQRSGWRAFRPERCRPVRRRAPLSEGLAKTTACQIAEAL